MSENPDALSQLIAAGARFVRLREAGTRPAGERIEIDGSRTPIPARTFSGKEPFDEKWQEIYLSAEDVRSHITSGGNIGLEPASIGMSAMDVDEGDPTWLRAAYPTPLQQTTMNGGIHLLYRDDVPRINAEWSFLGCKGDIRSRGGQIRIYGPPEEAFAVIAREIDNVPTLPAGATVREKIAANAPGSTYEGSGLTLADIQDALRWVDPDGHDEWLRVGMALKAEWGEDAWETYDEWSSRSKAGNYDRQRNWERWNTFRLPEKIIENVHVTVRSIAADARLKGWRSVQSADFEELPPVVVMPPVTSNAVMPDADKIAFAQKSTEIGFKAAWIQWHGPDFRFSAVNVKNAHFWKEGEGWVDGAEAHAAAYETVEISIVRLHTANAGSTDDAVKAAQEKASDRNVNAVMRKAAATPELLVLPDNWDADPMIAGTPGGGTVDLRTGEVSEPSRDQFLVKRLGAIPAATDAPVFRQYLDGVTGGDESLVAALQALMGSAILGIPETVFVIALGPGGTGKSQFAKLIQFVGGSYVSNIPKSAIVGLDRGEHPAALDVLRGLRGGLASEFKGGDWNTEWLKTITGGDQIVARGMGENFSAFDPTHTIMVFANPTNLPRSHVQDKAFKDRVFVIPFDRVFRDEADVVENMAEAIRDAGEMPAVAHWAVEGARIVASRGLRAILNENEAVQTATAAWMLDDDSVGLWLAENCIAGGDTEHKTVGADYRMWAEALDRPKLKVKTLIDELAGRGYPSLTTTDGKRIVRGLTPKAAVTPAPESP